MDHPVYPRKHTSYVYIDAFELLSVVSTIPLQQSSVVSIFSFEESTVSKTYKIIHNSCIYNDKY